MARRDRSEAFPVAELVALLESLQPELEPLFLKYCVSPDQAAEIQYETMAALGHRWYRVPDRRLWFLETVEARCQALGGSEKELPQETP
ncbi:MAG TPA: hypothetical protein VM599_04265 [Thermoanaerobaculia bacterium]|nr:hypothetical protein [Thermoanaerobaculia bacterium]